MANSLERITIDALCLSFEEREQLIASLLEAQDAPLSNEWTAEIERRILEIDSGLETIPAEEFFAEMHRKLDETRPLPSGTPR